MKFDMSAEAAEMLYLMSDEIALPDGWEASGACGHLVEGIAHFLVNHQPHIDIEDLTTLVAAGAVMAELAHRAPETADTMEPLKPWGLKGGAE